MLYGNVLPTDFNFPVPFHSANGSDMGCPIGVNSKGTYDGVGILHAAGLKRVKSARRDPISFTQQRLRGSPSDHKRPSFFFLDNRSLI